jgi:hypothetical protein
MRAYDSGDPAVEPAGERSLLAGRFGVHVDEDERRLAAGLLDEVVDELEHRSCGVEEQGSEDVDDCKAGAVRGWNDREPSSRRVARGVRRPDHAIGGIEVGVDLRAPEGVVPERDRIDTHREQLIREPRRDPDSIGGVLAVRDAGVDVELCP